MNSILNFDEWFILASQKIFRLVDEFSFLFNDDEEDDEFGEHIDYTLIKLVQAIRMPNNNILIGYMILNKEDDNVIHYTNFEMLDLEYHEEDQGDY